MSHARRGARDARLRGLLDSQHVVDQERAALRRGSQAWVAATDELQAINGELMHLAGAAENPPEDLHPRLQLDLEARPEDDQEFRSSVVRCVRQAVLARASEGMAARTADRLDSSGRTIGSALAAMDQAQATLRRRYPGAVLDAWGSATTTLSVLADRDGAVA